MAEPRTLQSSWQRGMYRDVPRHQLPPGAAWNLVDFLPPGPNGPLRERGGYAYASADISSTVASTTQVSVGIQATFAAGTKNLAISLTNVPVHTLVQIVSSSSTTSIGTVFAMTQNPVFHREKVIMPANDGTTAPKYYDGTTLGNLAGSPPAGKYATVYKDRTVLANSTANTNRLWFSGAGDPTTWDTTSGWWDVSHKVTGLFPLRNAILVFTNKDVERLRGSIPPPGSDFILDTLVDGGTSFTKSIVAYQDQCVWASTKGIYLTDGASVNDLTLECGFQSYWRELMADQTSTWTAAATTISQYYVTAIMDGTTFKDAFMIDIPRRMFVRLSNIKALGMWGQYAGLKSAARVADLSTLTTPSATYKNDGDGTAVAAVVETPFYEGDPRLKNWKNFYVEYDVRDAGSDNPTVQLSYVDSPEETSYTDLGSALAETTEATRAKVQGNLSWKSGIGLKLTRANASSDFRFYSIGAEVASVEGSRVKQ